MNILLKYLAETNKHSIVMCFVNIIQLFVISSN